MRRKRQHIRVRMSCAAARVDRRPGSTSRRAAEIEGLELLHDGDQRRGAMSTSKGSLSAHVGLLVLLGACSSSQVQPAPTPPRMVDVGYGEVDARLTPASVTSLTAEQIRSRSVRDIMALFETVPGASVERTNGRQSLRVRSVAANQAASNT